MTGSGMEMSGADLTTNQALFAEYLARIWRTSETSGNSSAFVHCYPITDSRYWKPWRARFGAPIHHWWCRSLEEAAGNYSWPDPSPSLTFAAIAARLRDAIAQNNAGQAREASLDLFRWGGVGRRPNDNSRLWIERKAAMGTLCESVQEAVQMLQPGSLEGLRAFDGTTFLMNAAMTKVYAAADPENLVIYDGRVGAALGLLAKRWLELRGESAVPRDLAFRWGVGRGKAVRNPSSTRYKFASLYSPSTSLLHHDAAWAAMVRKGSQILKHAASLSASVATVGGLERALFMIGYDVGSESALPDPMPDATEVQ